MVLAAATLAFVQRWREVVNNSQNPSQDLCKASLIWGAKTF